MITKILFQTSKTKPNQKCIHLINSYLTEDWTYIHFDDSQMIQFIQSHPIEGLEGILDKINKLKGPHKSDLFRYYFIYLFGGFHMDSDVMIYRNIRDVIQDYDFISVNSSVYTNSIFQGIIGAAPGNAIVKKALFMAYETDLELLKDDYHLFCKQLFLIVRDFSDNYKINLLKEHRLNVDRDIITNNNNKIFFKHYWRFKKIPFSIKDYIKIFQNILKKNNYFDSLTFEFTKIYKNNFWKGGSGSGSRIENTKLYNELLVNFITANHLKTITDLGCGDWQSSHLIYNSLNHVDYIGIDCVGKVILDNQMRYPKYIFKCYNFLKNLDKIRDSDLYIIKDVLQHLKLADIYKLLDYLTKKNFKYILICNYANQNIEEEELNHYLGVGRGLNSKYFPLKKYNAIPLLDYFGDEDKHVCLIEKRTI